MVRTPADPTLRADGLDLTGVQPGREQPSLGALCDALQASPLSYDRKRFIESNRFGSHEVRESPTLCPAAAAGWIPEAGKYVENSKPT